MDIPFDLLYIVASFYTKPRMKLLDWIPEDKLNWIGLSKNPNALHLLEQNPDKIFWHSLSQNPNAIHLLEKHLDEIDWENLSGNPNALHMLEANSNKIAWWRLSMNPSIFEIDTKQTQIHLIKKAKDTYDYL